MSWLTSMSVEKYRMIEIDKETKLLPFFIPMPKKDAVCADAALKEALTMCQDRNLHPSRRRRVNSQSKAQRSMLGEEHYVVVLSSSSAVLQWHYGACGWHPQKYSPSNAVLRLSIRRPRDERESSRKGMGLSIVWTTCGHMD